VSDALARSGAQVTGRAIQAAIIALLTILRLGLIIATADRRGPAGDHIRDARRAIRKILLALPGRVECDDERHKGIGALLGVLGPGLVDAAGPVAEGGVADAAQGARVGDQVGVVVALQVAHDGKVANLAQAVDRGRLDGLVVARQGKVHARAGQASPVPAVGHKVDGVADQVQRARVSPGVVGGIRPDQHHVSRDGWRPRLFRVREELDVLERAAVRVRDDDRFVLLKVGRFHGIPLVHARHDMGCARIVSDLEYHTRPR
jgi:hypothetical protein